MVIICSQTRSDMGGIPYWDAIGGNIVRSLDVEGLFNFGIRSDEEMEDDEGRDEDIEENIWIILFSNNLKASIKFLITNPLHLEPSRHRVRELSKL